MNSDDQDSIDPTPIIEIPNKIHRRSHQDAITQYNFANMCPDTPESPTPENRGHSDNTCPDAIPNPPPSILLNNPPNIMSVADGLRNLTLHPHPQRNEWVTSCLVYGKSYDQVLEETVADYLDQTAQQVKTVRERQIKRNALIDGIQSGVFTFIPTGVSQAAACDGLVYSVNYNGQNSGTQGYAMPLFEY